ncbi:di-trans,poly-cis-decaprenylcistransferase [Rhodoferax sp. TH121]|uniref:polyprenyl diphosphate synthase n=1 Tax=Rhodoferax sp. TH121 TaxID=2022803 RepID=UPI000B95FE3B|nr:polyprenyl diphosphate synthase [Rhodoferax sp. TH121]OYQ40006.1 di-trans,poly-cis-decaprenylcistransferase [Rhodoferax sp. TH121]
MAHPDAGPQHIAIVMDGNGRWATKRFLPRIAGHKQGVDNLKRIVRACAQRQIAVLTVFAFSSENWSRPQEEVTGLMDLLAGALSREVSQLKQDGVRLRFVGDRSGLSDRVQAGLTRAELDTMDNRLLTLNVCFNYGGRWEIAQAAADLAARGEAITESSLSQVLLRNIESDPDLLIRTGGEFRLSNFLLWQAAYTELHFSPAFWPDFDEHALDLAITEYHARERRFGKTSAQVAQASVPPL